MAPFFKSPMVEIAHAAKSRTKDNQDCLHLLRSWLQLRCLATEGIVNIYAKWNHPRRCHGVSTCIKGKFAGGHTSNSQERLTKPLIRGWKRVSRGIVG